MFRNRSLLVLGATGFIGRHLCAALVELGAEVYAAARRDIHVPVGVRFCPVDVRDARAVQTLVRDTQPRAIFHMAGYVTGRQEIDLVLPMMEHNLIGSVHAMLAAVEAGCGRFVLASSAEEPGTIQKQPPNSPYAASKAAVTAYARIFNDLYGLGMVSLRLFLTYGPGQQTDKLIPYAIEELLAGRAPQIHSGDRVCDFVYVQDVVRGLLMAAIAPEAAGTTIELATGNATSIRNVVNLLTELTGSRASPVFDNPERRNENTLTGDAMASREKLNWQPRWSLREGLSATVEWYRSNMAKQYGAT